MNQYRATQERALFRFLVLAIAVLLLLCLIAVATLGVLKMAMRSDTPDDEVPPYDEPGQPDDEQDDRTPAPDDDKGTVNPDPTDDPESTPEDTPAGTTTPVVLLPETADAGQSYIDQMIFLGESTTAHLRSRGVLSGGKQTKQVWMDDSGTMMLSLEILKKKIIYPETGESMTIEAAVAQSKPRYMVLSFGVNGLTGFHSNPKLYASSYAKLISAIKAASPETVIILQTVYPVNDNQTAFYQDAATLNSYIDALNEQLLTIASTNGVYLVDTASVLKDEQGNLRQGYDTDGLHLSAAAYEAVLQQLRTHAAP